MPGKSLHFIRQPELPADIRIVVRWRQNDTMPLNSMVNGRERERREGRQLIKDAISEYLGTGRLTIRTEEGGKPYASLDDQPVHISISHNPWMICGVISPYRSVGVDLESIRRDVHPALKRRISHPSEDEGVHGLPALQLWTLKEAALKWCGSGLRTAMNRVCVVDARSPFFRLQLPDKRIVSLYSLRFQDHWVSVAYSANSGSDSRDKKGFNGG